VENTKISSIDKHGQLGGFAGYGNGQGSTIKNCASINVTFSGGGYNAPISNFAPFSDCYTSASDSHTCSNISVEHKEVKATCEYPGLSNYKYCLVCGNITSGTKTETPATGHTWTPATCQAPKTCSSCGLTEGSTETHKYTTYTLSSNAMCGTNAQETASCDYGCGTTDTREISGTALVHSLTYSASGNTITAVCANGENCPNPQSTLTISAPAELYTDGTIPREATVENNLADTSVEVGRRRERSRWQVVRFIGAIRPVCRAVGVACRLRFGRIGLCYLDGLAQCQAHGFFLCQNLADTEKAG
jgi:hypothetical protein